MADLDDFFAKKDRKKKTTKKFATTEEVAKKLEDTAKKTEKQKKEKVPEGDESNAQAHEQDEWKEFEEEKKDYTGLKIGNLTINPNQENSATNAEAGSGDQPGEGGELGSDADRKAGPWKRIDREPDSVQEIEPPRPVEKKPEPITAGGGTIVGGTYKPPSMRHVSSQPTNAPPGRLRGNRGAAPDIHNEEFFPTLSKGSEKKTRGEGSFEVVQQHRASSYRQQMEQSKGTSGPRLNLGNRYNTLSNDS